MQQNGLVMRQPSQSVIKTSIEQPSIEQPSICKGCNTYRSREDWQLSIFGDYICKFCLTQERLTYPDLYVGYQPSRVEQEQARIKRRKYERIAPDDVVACMYCKRLHKSGEPRSQWIKFDDGPDDWLCKWCLDARIDLRGGQWRQDIYGRIFWVTDQLRARYPFGIRKKIPASYITRGACETLFNIQSERMFRLLQQHTEFLDKLIHRYAANPVASYVSLDETQLHDLFFDAGLQVASLHDEFKSFHPYLAVSARNAFFKEVRKRTDNIDKYTVLPVQEHLEFYPTDPFELRDKVFIEAVMLRECQQRFGEVNWEIFKRWLLNGESQRQIGEGIGIISQAVGERIKAGKAKCASLKYDVDEHKQWTLTELAITILRQLEATL